MRSLVGEDYTGREDAECPELLERERRKQKARRSKLWAWRSKHKARRRPENWKPHHEHEDAEDRHIARRVEA